MKTKVFIKRALSVLLVSVMLFSCWVFAAPTEAVAADSKYTIRVTINVTGTNNCKKSYGGFESAVGDSCGVTVRCATNNGNGSSTDLNWDLGNNGLGIINGSTGSKTLATKTSTGFPTHLYLYICDDYWFSGIGFSVTKLEVKGESQSSYTTLWSGTMHVASKTNGYGGWIRYDGHVKGFDHGLKNADEGSTGDDNNYINASDKVGWQSKMPYRYSGGAVSGSNITLDGTSTKTSDITVAAAEDQYGVTYSTSNLSTSMSTPTYNSSYVTYSGDSGSPARRISATKDAHISTVNVNSQSVTITASFATKNTTNTASSTKTTKSITITDEKYTYTWNWKETNTSNLDSPTDKSTTASPYYGDTPSVPAAATATTAYYTTSKHWSGGTYSNPGVATQARSYTMSYSTNGAAHSYSYSEISGNNTNHKASCSCGYSKSVAHSYGSTGFTFAENGKKATASRQCSTTGCKHIQSQEVNCTSVEKTAATCTTVGTTTYTATSPFGDGATATKDVNDLAALGHDWNATTFSFASDGKTATATRVCNRNANHTESQAAVVTSAVKTAATCTTVGTTTYTATSPFGDGATSSVDKNDIPALGHNTTGQAWQTSAEQHWKNCNNGCGVKQDLANHDWNAWTDNGDGTHYRTCKVCGYRASASHSGYTSETTAPTCTAQGYTTYTCPTCNYSYVDNYTTALGHDASGAYQSDGSNHWKVCQRAGCGVDIYDNNGTWTAGRTGHAWNEGEVTTQPTCTETGVLTKTCTVCGNDSNTSVVPARGHDYT
ncbi:MAG: hypothetical protein IJI67_02325, partial [Clostridia bacterium]|nr:hypothetical protein [Clostridia bacterium]